jgi:hypothetical protein
LAFVKILYKYASPVDDAAVRVTDHCQALRDLVAIIECSPSRGARVAGCPTHAEAGAHIAAALTRLVEIELGTAARPVLPYLPSPGWAFLPGPHHADALAASVARMRTGPPGTDASLAAPLECIVRTVAESYFGAAAAAAGNPPAITVVHGPPGCGLTSIARRIAHELGSPDEGGQRRTIPVRGAGVRAPLQVVMHSCHVDTSDVVPICVGGADADGTCGAARRSRGPGGQGARCEGNASAAAQHQSSQCRHRSLLCRLMAELSSALDLGLFPPGPRESPEERFVMTMDALREDDREAGGGGSADDTAGEVASINSTLDINSTLPHGTKIRGGVDNASDGKEGKDDATPIVVPSPQSLPLPSSSPATTTAGATVAAVAAPARPVVTVIVDGFEALAGSRNETRCDPCATCGAAPDTGAFLTWLMAELPDCLRLIVTVRIEDDDPRSRALLWSLQRSVPRTSLLPVPALRPATTIPLAASLLALALPLPVHLESIFKAHPNACPTVGLCAAVAWLIGKCNPEAVKALRQAAAATTGGDGDNADSNSTSNSQSKKEVDNDDDNDGCAVPLARAVAWQTVRLARSMFHTLAGRDLAGEAIALVVRSPSGLADTDACALLAVPFAMWHLLVTELAPVIERGERGRWRASPELRLVVDGPDCIQGLPDRAWTMQRLSSRLETEYVSSRYAEVSPGGEPPHLLTRRSLLLAKTLLHTNRAPLVVLADLDTVRQCPPALVASAWRRTVGGAAGTTQPEKQGKPQHKHLHPHSATAGAAADTVETAATPTAMYSSVLTPLCKYAPDVCSRSSPHADYLGVTDPHPARALAAIDAVAATAAHGRDIEPPTLSGALPSQPSSPSSNSSYRERSLATVRDALKGIMDRATKLLSADDPLVRAVRRRLARAALAEGKFKDALRLYDAFLVEQRAYEQGRVATADALVEISGLLFGLGDLARCREALEEAREVYETIYGLRHPRVMHCTVWVALIMAIRALPSFARWLPLRPGHLLDADRFVAKLMLLGLFFSPISLRFVITFFHPPSPPAERRPPRCATRHRYRQLSNPTRPPRSTAPTISCSSTA